MNKIIEGNCIEKMKQLPKDSVDMIFADPPYNLQLKNELLRPNQTRVEGVDDDWDKFNSFQEYDKFSLLWLSECRRILKPSGTIWVIGSYHNIFRVGKIMMDIGFWILNDVVWSKTNPMPNFRGTRFTNASETLIWAKFSEKSRYTFNYQAMKNINENKQMRSVWELPVCRGKERIKGKDGKKVHSTQKPEALLYRVVLSSSNIGDTILDPFAGTGTTGAVAKKLSRNFILIEQESKYTKVIEERVKKVTPLGQGVLKTYSKKKLKRVPFGNLVECGMIPPGFKITSNKGKAVVKADGTLISGNFEGSIHQVASYLAGRKVNGWTFWEGIDELRDEYRKNYHGDTN